jgi:hypothetical protein
VNYLVDFRALVLHEHGDAPSADTPPCTPSGSTTDYGTVIAASVRKTRMDERCPHLCRRAQTGDVSELSKIRDVFQSPLSAHRRARRKKIRRQPLQIESIFLKANSKNEQPCSKIRGIEQQKPKVYVASGGEYDPKRFNEAKSHVDSRHDRSILKLRPRSG